MKITNILALFFLLLIGSLRFYSLASILTGKVKTSTKIINQKTKKILVLLALFITTSSILQAKELTIYSYRQPFLLKPLLNAFEEQTGIKTKVLFLKVGLAERLESEGKFSPADLVLTVDVLRLNQLVTKGLLQPVKSRELEKNIPANLRDAQNLWFALSLRARVIYASKDRVPRGAVQNYQDLANEKWRKQICIRSGKHSYNLSLFASWIAENGIAETKKLLQAIKKNLARRPQGNDRSQVKAIDSGECSLSLGNSYYLGVMATNIENPEQKEWADSVYPITPNQQKEGTNVNISGMALPKYSPNKKEAILLMEFLISKKAQKIYAEVNHEFPVRKGVELSAFSKKNFGEFKKNNDAIFQIGKYYQEANDLVEEVRFDF